MTKKILMLFLPVLASIVGVSLYTRISAQSELIQNVRVDKTTVPAYEKIEWTFDVNKSYPNPYYYYDPSDIPSANPSNMNWFGQDGVTVNLVISTPNQETLNIPAFYYQDYAMRQLGGVSVLGKRGAPTWKARFSASIPGTYRWYLTLQDKSGNYRYPALGTNTFDVTDSTDPGFVRVSNVDPRFLAFDSGEPFIAAGSSEGVWAGDASLSYAYERLFKEYNQNGINLLRIWDQSDFSLSVEGANPVWIDSRTMGSPAAGVLIGNTEARNGLRAANPNIPWYQRVVVSDTNKPHALRAWVKGSSRVSIRSVGDNATIGNILAETPLKNSTDWEEVSLTYTPTTSVVAIYLSGAGGVDDVIFGPVKTDSTLEYNILSDGDFERHFSKDNPGNDPNANVQLPRPLGNYFNQWSSYHLDKIISDAEAYQVYLQLCSCSGPWFTWPANPEDPNPANYSDSWWLKSWQRNFRYRVARWGYSTSVLAWERKNEYGHVTPGTAVYEFYKKYGEFQKQTDPYRHLRTTSQGSQAVSPAFWSDNFFDIANYHDYMMSNRYPAQLYGDETNFVHQFSWCLREFNTCKGAGLGIGDGTSWNGAQKPWIWGEIGAGIPDWNSQPIDLATKGEGGARYIHNIAWAGMFSPLGTTPLDWTMYSNGDAISRKAFFDSRNALRKYFRGVRYDSERFTHLPSAPDKPTWWNGPVAEVTNNKLRTFNLVSNSKQNVYGWVQNRDNVWSNGARATTAVSGEVRIPGVTNGTYAIEYWNTRTGAITSQVTKNVTTGVLIIEANNLSSDFAYKAVSSASTPTPTPSASSSPAVSPSPVASPSPQVGSSDLNNDGKVDVADLQVVLRAWYQTGVGGPDIFQDGEVNSLDASLAMKQIYNVSLQSPTPTPAQPSSVSSPIPSASSGTPSGASTEWTQHAANAQRTSYVSLNIPAPWRWKWSWNGPNSSGGVVSGKTTLPRNVQAVTGNNMVYIAAGSRGVVALRQTDGTQAWIANPGGSFNSTLAYDAQTNAVFAVSSNGYLFKLNATTGQEQGQFNGNSTSTLPLPALVYGDRVLYSMGSRVYALNKSTLAQIWSYNTNNTVVTPPTYSQTKNRVIVGTQDLYVHAIDNTTGAQAWRTKPTVLASGAAQTELSRGWPVVADKTGIVLIKYRLNWDTLWTWSPWPTTNSLIRSNLTARPDQQALFALNLDNGQIAFNTNVGHGGYGDGNYMPMGPQPVVKDLGSNEVAYMVVRGDNVNDGRWDSKFGEVVLDNTISGFSPGDVRFMEYGSYGWQRHGNDYSNVAATPTDEQPNLSVVGNYLLGGHWMNAYAMRIEDRSAQYGNYDRPIRTAPAPHITSSTNAAVSGCQLTSSHYCSGSLIQDGDVRTFPPQGFYIYYNQGRLYDTYWSEYAAWSASGNTLYYRSNDGALIAFESGNPTANALEQAPSRVAGLEDVSTKSVSGVLTPESAAAHVGSRATIKGRIANSFNNGRAFYITFTEPHQGKFIIKINKESLQLFQDNPEKLYSVGSTISATGLIEMYQGGPVIYITDPAQLVLN